MRSLFSYFCRTSEELETQVAVAEDAAEVAMGVFRAQTQEGSESLDKLQQQCKTLKDALTITQHERNKVKFL